MVTIQADKSAEKEAFAIMAGVKYPYHNERHARDVTTTAMAIGAAENISEKEMTLLRIAAAFHDTGFAVSYKNNEPEGAKIAGNYMARHGYSDEEIQNVQDLIIYGTTMPQQPRTRLQQVLADADVANLGRKDFFIRGEEMRKELGVEDKLQWYEGSLKFIMDHRFFTESAERMFGKQQELNVDALKKAIKEEIRLRVNKSDAK